MMKNILLLGIDGGATKINGWTIEFDSNSNSFSLGDKNIQKKYSEYPSYDGAYKPVNIKIQLAEMNSTINLSEEEKKQGLAYMNAASDVILGLAKDNFNKKVLIGLGMPGLKTSDKKGISALANGPRMPKFVEFIETRLKAAKIDFFPVTHLGSDADYCGIGEEYDREGLFRDVENAYYLGGGTGVADAMKLKGKLMPFDMTKDWITKAWELKSKNELSLERFAAAGGIQYIYSRFSNVSVEELNNNHIYPPQILQKAINGDKAAFDTINIVSENVATLLFERITTIYFGSLGVFEFVNPQRAPLSQDHQFKGILLDRIVIGQRLGDLLQTSKSSILLWNQIIGELTKLISNIDDLNFKNHYLKGNTFNSDILQISKLREAPAIGAGVDAYLTNYQD